MGSSHIFYKKTVLKIRPIPIHTHKESFASLNLILFLITHLHSTYTVRKVNQTRVFTLCMQFSYFEMERTLNVILKVYTYYLLCIDFSVENNFVCLLDVNMICACTHNIFLISVRHFSKIRKDLSHMYHVIKEPLSMYIHFFTEIQM